MTDPHPASAFALFTAESRDAAGHFRLYVRGTILVVLQRLTETLEGPEGVLAKFPFLRDLAEWLDQAGFRWNERATVTAWFGELEAWERGLPGHLPLRELRRVSGCGHAGITMLLATALPEEDPRFGDVYAYLQGQSQPSAPPTGLLNAWWRELPFHDGSTTSVRQLQQLGFVRVTPGTSSRHLWPVHVPPLLWDALSETPVSFSADGYEFTSRPATPPDLIVDQAVGTALEQLPDLIATGAVGAVAVRGPQANGRRQFLRSLAHRLGRGMLTITLPPKPDDPRWVLFGPLATALHALPVVVCDLPPGETALVPVLTGYQGVLGATVARQGGIAGPGVSTAITIDLAVPDAAHRRELWLRALPALPEPVLAEVSRHHRFTSGNITRLGTLAAAQAALARRPQPILGDIRTAGRLLNRQILDTLATSIPTGSGWDELAVSDATLDELRTLEARCRHRETLAREGRAYSPGPGVRALFSGPSGTGKTLAARALAGALGLDLYRVDLSAVINKYIGETEKNLHQLLSRAEELDIVLLLDEGDALLTQRTAVANANDRYANLETSYLLQRLETFEGIIVVTTNASDRIDDAFQRRMDVVVGFRPPDAAERHRLWQLHLPADHRVDEALLGRVAGRCSLTGGQIRNAALHARVLALDNGGIVTSAYVQAAVEREYHKLGASSPLRPATIERIA
ncbi:MAG TPA: ATP-binding protein [Lacunisphaera sp.]|nr:ATP-binding protein [Lacunisphaera sp.]